MNILHYLKQFKHDILPQRTVYVISKPEWGAEDDALLRELATMPHFEALKKRVALRMASLNDEHLQKSEREYAHRIDECRILLSDIESRLIPRSSPNDE